MQNRQSASLRVAVIGCGAISSNHIASIQNAGQTLCALCDIDRSHAEEAAKKHGLSDVPIYEDYLEMLSAQSPDAVHICTPHYLHAPMCVAALERNVHVLCEKPLCISMEQLESIRRAAESSTAYLGVCLQNRYEPNFLRLRELTQEGVAACGGFVLWKRDESYYRSGAWRGTWEHEGGGVMINQALHTLDLLQWLCGMPDEVIAHVSNDHLKGVIEVEDTAQALFECADGRRFNFYATTAAGADFPVSLWFKLTSGKNVTAEIDLLTVNAQPLPSSVREVGIGKTEWGCGHGRLIADFYDCIANGRPFPIDVKEGEKVVRLILGMYASNGEKIKIPQ